jgi:hypothetical protein
MGAQSGAFRPGPRRGNGDGNARGRRAGQPRRRGALHGMWALTSLAGPGAVSRPRRILLQVQGDRSRSTQVRHGRYPGSSDAGDHSAHLSLDTVRPRPARRQSARHWVGSERRWAVETGSMTCPRVWDLRVDGRRAMQRAAKSVKNSRDVRRTLPPIRSERPLDWASRARPRARPCRSARKGRRSPAARLAIFAGCETHYYVLTAGVARMI